MFEFAVTDKHKLQNLVFHNTFRFFITDNQVFANSISLLQQDANFTDVVVAVEICSTFMDTQTHFTMCYTIFLSKVFSDDGAIKLSLMVCSPVRDMIHSLNLMNYLHAGGQNHSITISYDARYSYWVFL